MVPKIEKCIFLHKFKFTLTGHFFRMQFNILWFECLSVQNGMPLGRDCWGRCMCCMQHCSFIEKNVPCLLNQKNHWTKLDNTDVLVFFNSLQAFIYMFFLLVLSFALIHGSTRKNPNDYSEGVDKFRAVCELLMLLMLFVYIFEEVNQITRYHRLHALSNF